MPLLNPTPVRQQDKIFLTPRIEDFVFMETWSGQRKEVPAYGTPHPDTTKWPNHKLVYVKDANNEQKHDIYHVYYCATFGQQEQYNWEIGFADIGGTKFNSITLKYVTLRSAFTAATPTMGTALPAAVVVPGITNAEYVLAERKEGRIGDEMLDGLFVVDVQVYVRRCTQRQLGVDSLNGKMLFADERLYYSTEVVTGSTTAATLFADPTNAYWGLQTNGTQRSGKQLSCAWYLIITEQVVSGTAIPESNIVVVDAYYTTKSYYWPPVLEQFELMDWVRNDGGTDIYPAARYNPEGYQGPCRAYVQRWWSVTPHTIPDLEQMNPTRIYYSCPYFTANISECLHSAIAMQCDIGTEDPVYDQNTGSTRYFGATNFTAWPASVTAHDEQEPFRGGYLRTAITVYKPSSGTPGSWT